MKMVKQDKLKINYQIKSNLATYKELDESSRVIKAVANTYNFYDFDGDVLRPGCCKRSIDHRGANSDANDKILHALNHDLTTLPGKSLIEKERTVNGNKVLYTESYLPETTLGEDTLINYKTGIYNQHSIGFRYIQIEYVEKEAEGWDDFIKDLINPEEAERFGYGWEVKEINLHEWSTVAFGANKLTPYLGTKSENKNIQLLNVYSKLDALIKKAKSLDIKDKKVFNLQMDQLKQMIKEISETQTLKDTLIDSSKKQPEDDFIKEYYLTKLT
jgi:phage head maturation protease